MPGISLQVTSQPATREMLCQFEAAQSHMLHEPDYGQHIHIAENGIIVGHVGYAEYPVTSFSTDVADVVLEGCIYNCSAHDLETSIRSLAGTLCQDSTDAVKVVREWILQHDGEYLVVVAPRHGHQVFVFNDIFGRLPWYHSSSSDRLIISRECKFILQSSKRCSFDRLAWAESLWFGYPLGQRTLFQDIEHAPGGVLLKATMGPDRITSSISRLYEFNFDEKDTRGRKVSAWAADLADAFQQAVKLRAGYPDVSKNIVSLSGGQDSRAVAAAYDHCDADAIAATFVSAEGHGRNDAVWAEQIAASLGMRWDQIEVPLQDSRQEERLLTLKDGLNYLAMAFILPFMDELVRRWGRGAVYVTGDGGDKVLPNLLPQARPRSDQQLLETIVAGHGTLASAEVAEAAMGLQRGTLPSELLKVLAQYPEKDRRQKAVHFSFDQRGRQWLYEGEDRARFFMWETSPFYSLPFARMAMSVPDRFKAYNRLYREFQLRLSPAASKIPDATYRLPIASPWFVPALQLRRNLPSGLKSRLRGLTVGKSHKSAPSPETLSNAEQLAQEMGGSPAAVRKLLSEVSTNGLQQWRTLAGLHAKWKQEASLEPLTQAVVGPGSVGAH